MADFEGLEGRVRAGLAHFAREYTLSLISVSDTILQVFESILE